MACLNVPSLLICLCAGSTVIFLSSAPIFSHYLTVSVEVETWGERRDATKAGVEPWLLPFNHKVTAATEAHFKQFLQLQIRYISYTCNSAGAAMQGVDLFYHLSYCHPTYKCISTREKNWWVPVFSVSINVNSETKLKMTHHLPLAAYSKVLSVLNTTCFILGGGNSDSPLQYQTVMVGKHGFRRG